MRVGLARETRARCVRCCVMLCSLQGGAEASVDPDPDYSTWLPPNGEAPHDQHYNHCVPCACVRAHGLVIGTPVYNTSGCEPHIGAGVLFPSYHPPSPVHPAVNVNLACIGWSGQMIATNTGAPSVLLQVPGQAPGVV